MLVIPVPVDIQVPIELTTISPIKIHEYGINPVLIYTEMFILSSEINTTAV